MQDEIGNKSAANKSLTATKPRYCFLAKVSPLLRLAMGRWLQYFIDADLENSKIVYTFVVL
jgi:hypothetical protein